MDEPFIRDRISSLRQEKQVSKRKMSLDLGHSTSVPTHLHFAK